MTPGLEILDYSIHGNAIDADSDRLLAAAAEAAGCPAAVRAIAPDCELRAEAPRVWLRFDLRSRRELSWVVAAADALRRRGHRVFPSPLAILQAEDKWETWHALRAAGVPTPETALAFEGRRFAPPVMIKPRAGWGAMGNRAVREAAGWAALDPPAGEDEIAQPFIPHTRSWILPAAAGRHLLAIEAGRDWRRDGEVRVRPPPPGGASLALAALAAVGLPAGTVDLLETGDGPVVLEVNASPRIPYPDLPGVDLAGPMVRAVLDWMEALP